jgi:hypothetical protein
MQAITKTQRERTNTVGAATILRCHPQHVQRLKRDPDFPKSVGAFRKDEYYVDELEAYLELRIKRRSEALAKRHAAQFKQQKRKG